ncbi:MAG: DUF2125 domain-containing protein [Pseudomonadota bacterium]
MTQPHSSNPGRPRNWGWRIVPFMLVGILFAAYSAYWFWLRGELDAGVDAWIAEQEAAGGEIAYASKTLDGYPFRFVLNVEAPVIRQPNGGAWSGEALQVVADPFDLLWRFARGGGGKVIARAPGENRLNLDWPFDETDDFIATLDERSALSLAWDATSMRNIGTTINSLAVVEAETGDAFAVSDFKLSFGPAADGNAARLSVVWDSIELPEAQLFDGMDILGVELNGLAAIEVSDFFSSDGLGSWARAGGAVKVPQIVFNWGPLKAGVKADLRLNDQQQVDGTISGRLEDVAELKAALAASGRMDDETARTLDMIALASKDGAFATLSIVNGKGTFLGQTVFELPSLNDLGIPDAQ